MEGLLGLETEYAVTVLDQHGVSQERTGFLLEMLQLVRSRWAHLPDRGGSGVFLQNGARLYIDCGAHPEFSTPECANPWDAVRYVQAGERILDRLATEVRQYEGRAVEALVFRCNVDYGGTGATWGCHESYLYRRDPRAMPAQMIPHLASRIVYSGAGGFNSLSHAGLHFTLSPRTWHLDTAVSENSTHFRGIYHTKNEPLGAGYNRLHLVCGESLCGETASLLKVGTTALVVALADAELGPGEGVQLEDPLAAMRIFASDPQCRAAVPLAGGGETTALDIQRHYLELAERHMNDRFMPPWTEAVCALWREILEALQEAPLPVATRLDWAIKEAVYEQRLRRRGFSWASVEHWNYIAGRLLEAQATEDGKPQRLRAERVLGRRSRAAAEVARLTPYLRENGLVWDDLAPFLALRAELFEVDTRFGQLGKKGLFSAMDLAGVLSHRVAGVEDIEDAVENAPSSGRARLRGAYVRELTGAGNRYMCDWDTVWDHEVRRRLDLKDPFAETAEWTEVETRPETTGSPFFFARTLGRGHVAHRLYDRATEECRQSRLERSLPLLERVAAMVSPTPSSLFHWTHFWRSAVLQGLGRIREASDAVRQTLATPGGADEVRYKAMTRRVLVMLDRPEPLQEMRIALQEARDFVRDAGHPEWTSRLLLVQARLDAARGLDAESQDAAAQAMAAMRTDSASYTLSSYVRTLFTASLRLGQHDMARACLDELRAYGGRGHWGDLALACCQSELDRCLGRPDEALRWGKTAARHARYSEDQGEKVNAESVLVRALMSVGDMKKAMERRARLLPYRRGEVASHRYEIRVLCGDLHLNQARRVAGLSLVAPESGVEFVATSRRVMRDDVGQRLTLAATAYRAARREGRRIDRLLECDLRQGEVRDRLALLQITREQIGSATGGIAGDDVSRAADRHDGEYHEREAR